MSDCRIPPPVWLRGGQGQLTEGREAPGVERGNLVCLSVSQRLPRSSPGAVVRDWAGWAEAEAGAQAGRRGRRRGSLTPGAMQLRLPPPVTLGPHSEDTAFFP